MDDAMDEMGGHETIRITESESEKSKPLSEDPLIGKLLDGRYLIIQELGHGGFGSVYLASDEKVMSKRVVVKVLKETGNEWSIRKFRHEIEALARIDHSGIVGIVDTGQLSEGNPYIVMRYVNGVTLRSCLTPEGMSLERASDLIKQIGSALAAAHDKGILHRDLKPENIMVQSSGGDEQITIVDFGLAKVKKSIVSTSTVQPSTFGTLYYMSPEQFRGWGISIPSDIYSLGIIAYEMVTGRRPFNADTVAQLIELQHDHVKIKPKDLRPALPERSQNMILRALSFDPAARPQDARKFADGLADSMINDHELEARHLAPAATTEKVLKTGKASGFANRGGRGWVLGFAVLFIACVSAAVIWKNRSALIAQSATSSMNDLLVNSVAVLPFAVRSTNPDAEYISDGITETLIDELSQLPSMKRVIARTSVFRFKDRDVDPQSVGRELQVGAVLFGQITQQGDEFAISAELVSTEDDRHIWGAQYTLTIANTLARQKEISRAIVLSLEKRLAGKESPRAKNYPQNNEAYLLYLKGRYFLNKRDFKLAIDYFQQAINKDAAYSLAYAGLADCYSATNAQPSDTMPKAKAAALKALSLDDTLAEGHASLALIMFRYEWNWPDAELEFKRAIELNPNYSAAHQWYSLYLLASDRSAEAMEEITRAQQLDPLSVRVSASLGTVFLFTQQYDNAIVQWKKTLEIEPNAPSVHALLRTAYQQKGIFDEAYSEAQKEFASRFNVQQIEEIKQAYATSGYEGLLAKELEMERERSKRDYVPATGVARIYAALGQKDQAFAWLDKAYENREDGLVYIKVDPRYDRLRSDPRFSDLLHRVGLAH